jgi:hypothetical protein
VGSVAVLGFVAACVAFFGSSKPPQSLANQDQPKGKSLEEVQKEARAKEDSVMKSKEWQLIEAGQIDEAIAEFKSLKPNKDTETRLRILHLMGRLVKGQSQSSSKTMDFLIAQTGNSELRPNERLAAMNSLAQLGARIPAYFKKSESAIARYWGSEDRPGPRGAILMAMAQMKSPEGFTILSTEVDKLVKSKDQENHAAATAALYALSEYANSESFEQKAASKIDALASASSHYKLLGAKLLGLHRSMLGEKYFQELLAKKEDPASLEAGIYVVGKLKLRKYADQIRAMADSGAGASVLSPTFAEAFKELGIPFHMAEAPKDGRVPGAEAKSGSSGK